MISLERYIIIRRIFIEFLKVAFIDHPTYGYSDDKSATKILIFDSWHNSDKTQDRRPRIVVSRGDIGNTLRVVSDRFSEDLIDNKKEEVHFKSVQLKINIISDSDLVCDNIASIVERYMVAAKKDFGKRGVTLIDYRISPPIKMRDDSSYPKSFLVRIVAFVNYNFNIKIDGGGTLMEEFDIKLGE